MITRGSKIILLTTVYKKLYTTYKIKREPYVKITNMSTTWVVQFGTRWYGKHDLDNADTRVQRLLTPDEIKRFEKLCTDYNAQLVFVEVGPGEGWHFKINTYQQSHIDLHYAINEFVKQLNQ